MNFRQRITLYLLLCIGLGSVAFAQVVDIPDPNLCTAVRDALNVPGDAAITKSALQHLTKLVANSRGIESLQGLEFATELQHLQLRSNQIVDIRPLANLKQLDTLIILDNRITDLAPLANLTELVELNARDNPISDVSPLSNLRVLKYLDLSRCNIIDLTPLKHLTNLEVLQLNHNRIVDVTPLSGLTRLYKLEIDQNYIVDHSPLDALPLTHFIYDQLCDIPPLPLESRLDNRTYPSAFGAEWAFGRDARLDLIYGINYFSVYWRDDGHYAGDVAQAIQQRDELLASNPNMVFLLNVHMRADLISRYGTDWEFWVRDANGDIVKADDEWGLMDFTLPTIQDLIVEQAVAISKCGLFDGIVFDWWRDGSVVLADHRSGWAHGYRGVEAEDRARKAILTRIRAQTRPDFLIQVNSNWRQLPLTGRHINGLSMETGIPNWHTDNAWFDGWDDVLSETENTLLWAEENLREPRITGVVGEAFSLPEPFDSPQNRRWMRVLTTLVLTHSDGYVEYTGWWDTQGVVRDFGFDFLEADIGRSVGAKAQVYDDREGLFIREFTNGWAVYNRSGEAQVITLPEEVQGVASGLVNTEHELPNLDGEIYLRVKPKNPVDVNEDGVVNIFDLTIVAQAFGTGKREGDVNGDGVVNVFDLVFVANEF